MDNKLKVLIVDDSRIFRSMIEKILDEQKRIKVVGSVRNGIMAIEFIKANSVDIVTLDQEMPDMDGLETLKEIQKINATKNSSEKVGVIIVSAHTIKGAEITIKALEEGAFDFITKPETANVKKNIDILQRQLIAKLRDFSAKRLCPGKGSDVYRQKPLLPKESQTSASVKTLHDRNAGSANINAILIGVSTGGPKALLEMMPQLSEKINLPILIVQHMPPTFTLSLAKSLDAKCRHTVIEGGDNEIVKNDHLYIAPGGKHMELKKDANKNVLTVLTNTPPENGCRPSVDVLFRSATNVYRGNVIAIVLTGMGSDGTKGLTPLKQTGAYAVVQDEDTSVVWGMPGSAVNAGLADKVLPLNEIPDHVSSIVHNKR
ncbi:MAG: protein-glutamate methylesterase/protein-glutamine glutaminase [Candidatus Anammoxibacter sp.]